MSGYIGIRLAWVATAIWLSVTVGSLIFDFGAMGPALAAVGGLAFVVGVAVHAAGEIGWRGFAVQFVGAFAIGLTAEATSIHYGFPFGFFEHHMHAPRLFDVPIPVAMGYPLLCWPAWCLARLIVRQHACIAGRFDRHLTPLVGAFILAGYDLPLDPIDASVLGMWTYRSPSGLFGVPLSNFLGWLLTAYVLLVFVSWCEHRFAGGAARRTRGFWALPIIVWLGNAAPYPIQFLQAPSGSSAPGGRQFVTADIYETSVILSLFSLVFVALATFSRLVSEPRPHRE